ncbi:SCO2525 family SAM-dependent methyltransferase [Sphaerisporangium dianthi]|uniref:SCO2525 family SAM-dependent methyltransferase n=1 Tax=Sphaerisporangium dianthi TaxID=1436120 RepID=A0ABV9CRP1_9ACTN
MHADPEVGTGAAGHNSDFPWDEFDSQSYYRHNYRTIRDDDRAILGEVRDFFSSFGDRSGLKGLDVGTGANLYPALALLPLCDEITMWEYSESNVVWLRRELRGYSGFLDAALKVLTGRGLGYSRTWDAFWEVLCEKGLYGGVDDPRKTLKARARVCRSSIFELPPQQWDAGTMFFAAESLTGDEGEFESAVQCFLGALRPGAPFVIASMENSQGYTVGKYRYPAVAIEEDDLRKMLKDRATGTSVRHIESDGSLRTGYSGMILARGILRE